MTIISGQTNHEPDDFDFESSAGLSGLTVLSSLAGSSGLTVVSSLAGSSGLTVVSSLAGSSGLTVVSSLAGSSGLTVVSSLAGSSGLTVVVVVVDGLTPALNTGRINEKSSALWGLVIKRQLTCISTFIF